MIEILRKLFEANPEKSTIVLNGKCSDCGCETIIEITPTSEGFGLQGGALFKYSSEDYLVKCHDCCQTNPIISIGYKPQRCYSQLCKIADHCR
jgi:hypothetical protein